MNKKSQHTDRIQRLYARCDEESEKWPIGPVEYRNILEQYCDIQTNGRKCVGVSDQCNPMHPPAWFDSVAFCRAQKLFRSYSVVMGLTQLYGLLLCLGSQTEILLPLLTTGNSRSTACLFGRYLSTVLHVKFWFEHDPFDPNSKSYRSLKMVRGLHRQVAQKLNRKESGSSLWLNQHDMAETQFAFMGLMAIFPKQLGFGLFNREDFHAVFHFWRVIGYCLGTEDRFNLCSGSDGQIVQLCQLIWADWQPKLQCEPIGTQMSRSIVEALSKTNPNVNYNALFHYAAPFLGFNVEHFPLDSFKCRMAYRVLKNVLRLANRSRHWARLISKLGFITLHIQIKLRYSECTRSLDKSNQFETDSRCPFNVQINYRNAIESGLY